MTFTIKFGSKEMAMPDHTPRLLDAMDAFDEGIYIVSNDYTVEYMNRYMRDIFGDGVGKKCHDVLNQTDMPCTWCNSDEIFKKKKAHHSRVHIESVDKTFYLSEMPVENEDGTWSKLSVFRDITETVQREKNYESSKESYQRLFNHVGCGVFISSKEGRFLDVNPTLLEMLGYQDKDEFLSLDLANDVYQTPEDRRRYTRTIEKKGKVVNYEAKWRRRDGHLLHVMITSNVRYDIQNNILGYEGIVVDQTRRKEQERQVKETYDFLEKIISCSPNAIMAMDMKGNIKLWNRRSEEIFGVPASQALRGMNIRQIFTKRGSERVMEMIRSDRHGGKGRLNAFLFKFDRSPGNQLEGNLSAAILYDDKGEELASVAIFADLKEQLQAERELNEARQHLLQSEKLAAMGRLTSQLAHELNNPLFGIMNTLELMKTEISPRNKRRRLLDMSLSETVRLADMLKKMLSFSKPDQEERLEIDINVVIDELMLLYEKRFRENSIKTTLDLVEDPGLIVASRDQLRQVFINMFSNAMYAMPDGGRLEITTRVKGKLLFITIEDSGTGILPEHREKIFDSFFTTKTESVQGVGLGLSVCYGFVKDHGGDITVASEVGKWTKFTISLPMNN